MPMMHRMLLVEDDELTCSLMRSIFASKDLEIVTAHTVAEALALLDSRPDYLILDCTLPDGDGIEVLERVRADGLTTRVAVVSGWTDQGTVEGLRPDAVVRKPVNIDEPHASPGHRTTGDS